MGAQGCPGVLAEHKPGWGSRAATVHSLLAIQAIWGDGPGLRCEHPSPDWGPRLSGPASHGAVGSLPASSWTTAPASREGEAGWQRGGLGLGVGQGHR